MNVQKSLIVLSISLLISWQAVDAAPFVYVANGTSSSFSVIDQATGAPIAGSPFAVPNSANLVGVAISTDNKTAYMIDNNHNTLLAIDIATNNIVSTTDLSGIPLIPEAIAIDGTTAYIAGLDLGNAAILVPVNIADPSAPILGSVTVLTNPLVGQEEEIGGLVISNHVAYITLLIQISLSQYAYGFYKVDLLTLNQTYYQSNPDTSFPFGVAIDTATDTAYVVFAGKNEVQPFDLSPAPAGYPISVGTSPYGIAITPDNHYAYVTNLGDGTVSVIDLTLLTPSVTSTIMGVSNISKNLENIAISLDGRTVYVATGNNSNNTVTPITVGSPLAGTPIAVSGGAYALAVTGQVIPSAGVAAPTNVVGVRKNNVFLLQTARMLTITWTASVTPDVTSYNIYNGTTLVGNVLATSPLTFNAFVPAGDSGNNLFVSAVSSLGGESALVPVVVS